MKNEIKKLVAIMLVVFAIVAMVACGTEAEQVSYNVSQEADNFNVIRRLTVLNARSDKPMFELIGAFSIKVDAGDNQLEVTCETGKNETGSGEQQWRISEQRRKLPQRFIKSRIRHFV